MKHVDPETLAAWSDGGLAPDEGRAVESHLADCAQCRAVAAAFGRTLDTPAAVAPAGAVSSVSAATKWILPFAATIVIATGVAWKFWPRDEKPIEMAAVIEQRRIEAPTPSGFMPPVSAPPVENAPAEKAPAKREQPKTMLSPSGVSGAVPPAAPAVAPPAIAPIPSPAPPPPPLTVSESVRVEARPPLISTSRMSVSGGLEPQWQVIELTVPPAIASTGAGRGGGGRQNVSANTAAPQVVIPPRWRVTGPAAVERSVDGGSTWTAVPLDAPGLVITNGSATPSACWIVGEAGVVMISRFGGPFTRVPFPETANLKSILAIDDRRATVVTVDGRTFITDDGGQTWRIARF